MALICAYTKSFIFIFMTVATLTRHYHFLVSEHAPVSIYVFDFAACGCMAASTTNKYLPQVQASCVVQTNS